MIIDFASMKEEIIPEFKNGKGILAARTFAEPACRIMHGTLAPGSSVGYHKHETSCEVIYVLSGEAEFEYEDTREAVKAGGCHYCPKGHSHSVLNNGTEDLVYLAVVPEQ